MSVRVTVGEIVEMLKRFPQDSELVFAADHTKETFKRYRLRGIGGRMDGNMVTVSIDDCRIIKIKERKK